MRGSRVPFRITAVYELPALDNVMVALPKQFAEEPLARSSGRCTPRRQAQRREDALRTLEHVGLVDRARETCAIFRMASKSC